MLSRLVVKDILANLGPGVEPESRQALEMLLAQNGAATTTGYVQPRPESLAPQPPVVLPPLLPVRATNGQQSGVGWQPLTPDDIALRKATAEAKGGTFTDADVETINNEREMTWNAQQTMATAIPMEAMSRPAIPDIRVERVAKGVKNSRGELCIAVDPESGCSTYQCHNGHGYTDNNPVIRGCPTCWREEGSTAARRDEEDEGAIPGVDSRF